MIKNLLMSVLYFFTFLIITTIPLTILNYFNLLGNGIIKVLKLLIPIIGIIINSYKLGKKSLKRGYLEGIKFGGIIIFIFFIISLISHGFKIKSIIYYLIILLVSILSSMIGINKKKVTD